MSVNESKLSSLADKLIEKAKPVEKVVKNEKKEVKLEVKKKK